MGKIFQLSKGKADNTSEIANDKDNNANGWLMLMFVFFIYVLTIVCFVKWSDVLLPQSFSTWFETDQLWLISMVIIFIVGIITQWLLHYFAFKYRGRKTQRATFYADNDKLEFIWTIIPVIVLAGLIIYGLFTWTDIMNVDTEDDPLVVELYAQQFKWNARYAGTIMFWVKPMYVWSKEPIFWALTLPTPMPRTILLWTNCTCPKEGKCSSKCAPKMYCTLLTCRTLGLKWIAYQEWLRNFPLPHHHDRKMRSNPDMVEKVKHINDIRAKKSEVLLAKGGSPGAVWIWLPPSL